MSSYYFVLIASALGTVPSPWPHNHARFGVRPIYATNLRLRDASASLNYSVSSFWVTIAQTAFSAQRRRLSISPFLHFCHLYGAHADAPHPQTASLVQSAELDIGPRLLELRVPHRAPLDIDVAPSDAEIISRVSGAYAGALAALETCAQATRDATRLRAECLEAQRTAAGERVLRLKRQRDFDVDGAEAEWRVGEGEVVVFV